VRPIVTFAVLDAGAEDRGVLLVHHTAAAPGASDDVMLGSDAHVPVTEPLPTAAPSVHAVVVVTGHATTSTVWARAVELPATTETVVLVVPAMFPVFVRVTGFVSDVTVDEKVVVIADVPAIDPESLPMVTLDDADAVVVHSAHAALDPPATSTTVSSATRSTRRRRLTVPPASR
jgi:hypothetical protein